MAFLSIPSLFLLCMALSYFSCTCSASGLTRLVWCFRFSPVSATHAHSPVRNMPPPTMSTTSGRWPSQLSHLWDGHFCPQCCWVWLSHCTAWRGASRSPAREKLLVPLTCPTLENSLVHWAGEAGEAPQIPKFLSEKGSWFPSENASQITTCFCSLPDFWWFLPIFS